VVLTGCFGLLETSEAEAIAATAAVALAAAWQRGRQLQLWQHMYALPEVRCGCHSVACFNPDRRSAGMGGFVSTEDAGQPPLKEQRPHAVGAAGCAHAAEEQAAVVAEPSLNLEARKKGAGNNNATFAIGDLRIQETTQAFLFFPDKAGLPCKYFTTAKGCHRGPECSFAHVVRDLTFIWLLVFTHGLDFMRGMRMKRMLNSPPEWNRLRFNVACFTPLGLCWTACLLAGPEKFVSAPPTLLKAGGSSLRLQHQTRWLAHPHAQAINVVYHLGFQPWLLLQETSLSRFLKYLGSAKDTLDIAVFNITCNEIVDCIFTLHQKHVVVSHHRPLPGCQSFAFRTCMPLPADTYSAINGYYRCGSCIAAAGSVSCFERKMACTFVLVRRAMHARTAALWQHRCRFILSVM